MCMLHCKLPECRTYVLTSDQCPLSTLSIRLIRSTGLLDVYWMHQERIEGRMLFCFSFRVIVTTIKLVFCSAFWIPVHPLQSHGNEKWKNRTAIQRRKKKR